MNQKMDNIVKKTYIDNDTENVSEFSIAALTLLVINGGKVISECG
jgi:hypothetical protein